MTAATRLRLVADIPAWRPKSKEYGLNSGVSRWARAKHTKVAHKKVEDALMVAGWPMNLLRGDTRTGSYTLTFVVEQAHGKLPDSDNEASLLKACRDQIAKWLGCDDSPRGPIRWFYRSCRGPVDRVVMELEEAG